MNKLLNTLLTYSLVLFALSLAIPAYSQGPPSTRKEANDGSGQKIECIKDDGSDRDVPFSLVFDSEYQEFLEGCELYIGYDLLLSDMTYIQVQASEIIPNPKNSLEYLFAFTITLSAAEIAEMCEEENFVINLDLFCLENGEYISLSLGVGEDFLIKFCCNTENINGEMIQSTENKVYRYEDKELSQVSNKINKIQTIDYVIYDTHGNQVMNLKKISRNVSIQDQLSNLPIQTGIYFVRFWNGTKVETIKVFKL